ncbi:recombinase family protein [uncultured Desulfosarcina sp.]|uniref:recombinase family protein n=1 Tax=uncultured Desulfosarcina sp. TaxID=218289 RepID=UPI0029C6C60F|nr:recombinase family protein [uncultured Desulfosarcina sp.]
MKVYGYLRVSGKSQIDGLGFDRQEEAVRAYCERNGCELVKVFKEQVSGTVDEMHRQEFASMVSAILKNGVDTIIVESLDRLAREYRIQEQLLIYLASKGITLIVASTGENVTEAITADPMRKAMVQMQGVFAELDKSLLVKKLRKARDRKRQETGRCEGPKPFYPNSDVVKEIRRLRRRKKGTKQLTFDQVADRLNEQGFRSAKGQPFNSGSVRAILHRAMA